MHFAGHASPLSLSAGGRAHFAIAVEKIGQLPAKSSRMPRPDEE
jgi:hypothetical protein